MIKPTILTTMKNMSFAIVYFGNVSLYKTQISISAGHKNPNTDIHSAPTRFINIPMNGIAAAIAPVKRMFNTIRFSHVIARC